jgi:hypothetical protein
MPREPRPRLVLFRSTLPRFYLSLRDGEFLRDDEGQEFASLDAARDTAVRGAREIMAEDVKRGVLSLGDSVEITDENGQRVATVAFRDAIQING